MRKLGSSAVVLALSLFVVGCSKDTPAPATGGVNIQTGGSDTQKAGSKGMDDKAAAAKAKTDKDEADKKAKDAKDSGDKDSEEAGQ